MKQSLFFCSLDLSQPPYAALRITYDNGRLYDLVINQSAFKCGLRLVPHADKAVVPVELVGAQAILLANLESINNLTDASHQYDLTMGVLKDSNLRRQLEDFFGHTCPGSETLPWQR